MNAMVRRLLVAGAMALALQANAAGEIDTAVHIGIPHQALFDVAFSGVNGVAVGAGGEILSSSDSGRTWKQEESPNQLSLLGVAIAGQRSIAVGQMGLVLVKDVGGKWREVKTNTKERLMAVDMNSSGIAIAAGSFGTILKSVDKGETWTDVAPQWAPMFAEDAATLGDGFRPHIYTAKIDDAGHVIVAGELALIISSDNSGDSWKISHRGVHDADHVDPTIFDLALRNDGIGYAVGQSGSVLKTKDAGFTWQKIAVNSQANFLGVESGNDGRIIVTGMRDMLISQDEGASWKRPKFGDIAVSWYSKPARTADNSAYVVVGQSGKVLRFRTE